MHVYKYIMLCNTVHCCCNRAGVPLNLKGDRRPLVVQTDSSDEDVQCLSLYCFIWLIVRFFNNRQIVGLTDQTSHLNEQSS